MSVSLHNVETATLAVLAKCQRGDILLNSRDLARFWARVDRRGEAECWLWTGSRLGRRYGQFVVQVAPGKQKHLYAHRVAFTVAHGPIPAGAFVCHHCDTPLCCNPAHLFAGDQFDNMRDASAKGRLNVPRRRSRDIKGEAIAAYLAGGRTQKEVADAYSISKMTLVRWVSGLKPKFARPKKAEALSA